MSEKSAVRSPQAPRPVGPYSQAIRAGRFLFISGQLPIDPNTGQLVGGSVAEQTRRCMENIKAILAAAGASLKHIVKTTIYLADLKDFPAVNQAYANYFDLDPPARTTIQAAAVPKGAAIEMDAIAYLPSSD